MPSSHIRWIYILKSPSVAPYRQQQPGNPPHRPMVQRSVLGNVLGVIPIATPMRCGVLVAIHFNRVVRKRKSMLQKLLPVGAAVVAVVAVVSRLVLNRPVVLPLARNLLEESRLARNRPVVLPLARNLLPRPVV